MMFREMANMGSRSDEWRQFGPVGGMSGLDMPQIRGGMPSSNAGKASNLDAVTAKKKRLAEERKALEAELLQEETEIEEMELKMLKQKKIEMMRRKKEAMANISGGGTEDDGEDDVMKEIDNVLSDERYDYNRKTAKPSENNAELLKKEVFFSAMTEHDKIMKRGERHQPQKMQPSRGVASMLAALSNQEEFETEPVLKSCFRKSYQPQNTRPSREFESNSGKRPKRNQQEDVQPQKTHPSRGVAAMLAAMSNPQEFEHVEVEDPAAKKKWGQRHQRDGSQMIQAFGGGGPSREDSYSRNTTMGYDYQPHSNNRFLDDDGNIKNDSWGQDAGFGFGRKSNFDDSRGNGNSGPGYGGYGGYSRKSNFDDSRGHDILGAGYGNNTGYGQSNVARQSNDNNLGYGQTFDDNSYNFDPKDQRSDSVKTKMPKWEPIHDYQTEHYDDHHSELYQTQVQAQELLEREARQEYFGKDPELYQKQVQARELLERDVRHRKPSRPGVAQMLNIIGNEQAFEREPISKPTKRDLEWEERFKPCPPKKEKDAAHEGPKVYGGALGSFLSSLRDDPPELPWKEPPPPPQPSQQPQTAKTLRSRWGPEKTNVKMARKVETALKKQAKNKEMMTKEGAQIGYSNFISKGVLGKLDKLKSYNDHVAGPYSKKPDPAGTNLLSPTIASIDTSVSRPVHGVPAVHYTGPDRLKPRQVIPQPRNQPVYAQGAVPYFGPPTVLSEASSFTKFP